MSSEHETYEQILARLFSEAAHKEVKWILRGIVGLSVFCVCLGLIGIVSILKLLFS